uniref:Uncharacterized protein n=1 Tax=Parastrongyloides trichosuri TaxID=131310 RepID=A0A0N4ZHL2_PARTI
MKKNLLFKLLLLLIFILKSKTILLPSEYKCWGYEDDCNSNLSYSFSKIKCKKDTTAETKKIFFNQGDFGYIKPHISSLASICDSGDNINGSYLECSNHLRFCLGRNIYFDLKSLNIKTTKRYKDDVIHAGEVGGNCKVNFDNKLLKRRVDEKSFLQSWGSELEHFESYDTFNVDNHNCDVIFDKPTVIIKLDASVNLYHHFCDFLNLYASQHINKTFDKNIDILWWDTSAQGYIDETFGSVWKVFSNNKPKELIHYAGKKLCFKNAMFPLLARQIFGLFYNTPIVEGCSGTGLFDSFNIHLMERLNITQNGPILNKMRKK